MQQLETWLNIVIIVCSFFAAAIPFSIGLIKSIRDRIKAQTDAEREAAKNDMTSYLNGLISSAEKLYASADKALKEQGESAGALKKDSVLSKLQAYSIMNNYLYEGEYWSNKIDELVELTRQVNVK